MLLHLLNWTFPTYPALFLNGFAFFTWICSKDVHHAQGETDENNNLLAHHSGWSKELIWNDLVSRMQRVVACLSAGRDEWLCNCLLVDRWFYTISRRKWWKARVPITLWTLQFDGLQRKEKSKKVFCGLLIRKNTFSVSLLISINTIMRSVDCYWGNQVCDRVRYLMMAQAYCFYSVDRGAHR